MAQNHNADYSEKPMTTYGRTQGPSRRYRRLRHPTFPAAEWTAKNPLLQRGEIGIESDTHKIKIGDGITYWNNLAYSQDDGQPKSTADYNMGNSSGGWTTMSTAQKDALNSGATTTNITQIGTNTTTIGNHITNTNNPHNVTASQVGLGNVDNTSDADKPISTATQNALDLKANIADLGTAAYTDSTDYATAVQGGKADTALQPGDNVSELVNDAGYLTQHQTLADLGITATASEINVLDGITASTTELNYVDGVTSNIQTQLDNKQSTLTAGSNITITGTTISATDTTYTGSDGITLTGTNFTNSGVRAVASGTTNGTISVNTNGTSADVAVTGLGSAAYTASTDYATSAQGALADTAVQPGDLATVATTGDYTDLLNKPTIPAAQVNSDWDAVSGVAQILNKPTIPTVNDATLTIQKNGTNVATFTANASSNVTANISVPTDTGDLTNGAGYITGITSADVTSALGYTPYSDANPNGYTSNVGTVTSVNNTSPDGSGNVSLTIPTVNDATISVTQNGVSVGSFTLNQASGDTIALTDTTYSVMTGASAGDAGTSGLVPAPAAGDQGKFLQGDGTWANPTAATAWGNIAGTLSDQTDLQNALNSKANTDLDNLTTTGKETGAHLTMPSGTYDNLTLGADNTTYTAPADGWLELNKIATATNQRIGLLGPTFGSVIYSSGASQSLSVYIPVSKGDVVTIRYTAAGTINSFRFVYANGAV